MWMSHSLSHSLSLPCSISFSLGLQCWCAFSVWAKKMLSSTLRATADSPTNVAVSNALQWVEDFAERLHCLLCSHLVPTMGCVELYAGRFPDEKNVCAAIHEGILWSSSEPTGKHPKYLGGGRIVKWVQAVELWNEFNTPNKAHGTWLSFSVYLRGVVLTRRYRE